MPIEYTTALFRKGIISRIDIFENLYFPILSLLSGTIFQYYYLTYKNTYNNSDLKDPHFSKYIIIFMTFLHLSLQLIYTYKIVDYYYKHKLTIHIIINILFLIISSFFIILIIPTLLYQENYDSIYCVCENGKSDLTYIPSSDYCCIGCNRGYTRFDFMGQQTCVRE